MGSLTTDELLLHCTSPCKNGKRLRACEALRHEPHAGAVHEDQLRIARTCVALGVQICGKDPKLRRAAVECALELRLFQALLPAFAFAFEVEEDPRVLKMLVLGIEHTLTADPRDPMLALLSDSVNSAIQRVEGRGEDDYREVVGHMNELLVRLSPDEDADDSDDD